MSGRIIFIPESGDARDPVDVTAAMGALYDLCLNSMDYGSGFWTYEDANPVAEMAELMDWDGKEGITKYRDNRLYDKEQSEYLSALYPGHHFPQERYSDLFVTRSPGRLDPVYHDHWYSTMGKCLWPCCEATRDEE